MKLVNAIMFDFTPDEYSHFVEVSCLLEEMAEILKSKMGITDEDALQSEQGVIFNVPDLVHMTRIIDAICFEKGWKKV